MNRDILHIDMDAFYAAIEQRDNPEWRNQPLIVGSPPGQRGVVATCSYEARAFGIHSAMPSSKAAKLCPHAIFTKPDLARYAQVSEQIFKIFERFTPQVEPLSIDEAFLDISGAHSLFGNNLEIATKISRAINLETGLTASIGVAHNKFLAKLASDLKKPNGITVVPSDPCEIIDFLAPMPISKLWGVGAVTRRQLEQKGFYLIGDIQQADPEALARVIGKRAALILQALASGIDEREVTTDIEEKSLSREHTFDTDATDPEEIRIIMRTLVEDVGRRLRFAGKYAHTVRIKLRWSDFKTITRQTTLETAVCDDFTLLEYGLNLLKSEPLIQPVRLVGFGVSSLTDQSVTQMELLACDNRLKQEKRERLSQAVDTLRNRFNKNHPSLH